MDMIVVFFVGLGFLIWGVTTIVLTEAFSPAFGRLTPVIVFFGVPVLGVGGLLALWALVYGRAKTPG